MCFDTKPAHLNGAEYIISERIFKTFPPEERKYWHPHNYRFLSGELVASGLPGAAEESLMAKKMNSYGKTWHVWITDSQGNPGEPLGDPHLAWSFNHDNEAAAGLVEAAISGCESTVPPTGATVRISFRRHIRNQALTTSVVNSRDRRHPYRACADEKQAHQ